VADALTPAERLAVDRVVGRLELREGPLESRCWVNPRLPGGRYGQVRVGGKVMLAHRLLYRALIEEPSPDGHLHHLCETPTCANPFHLEDLTARAHFLLGDSSPARRARALQCIRGHEFTPENTYVDPTRGFRRCRECHREEVAARRAA
jgi:hypothetical protein